MKICSKKDPRETTWTELANEGTRSSSKKRRNPLLTKFVFLFVLVLLLQIPVMFIQNIIWERKDLHDSTVNTIGAEWGRRQRIIAPVFVLKYNVPQIRREEKKINGKLEQVSVTEYVPHSLAILPDHLEAIVEIKDDIRKRGIYQATVYNANIKMKGFFSKRNFPESDFSSYVSFGLSDTKGILKINKFEIDSFHDLKLNPGTEAAPLFASGISTQIPTMELPDKIPFEIDMDFRGSNQIALLPIAETNHFVIRSPWKSPSFGGILPSERQMSDHGFEATWEISHLVRNYPQAIPTDATYSDFSSESASYDAYPAMDIDEESVAKVSLFNSVTNYTQITRATKYGILFIMLSLIVVYIFEIASKRAAHYIQYGVVAFSLALFYLLLLSLSEHLDFKLAYALSSLAIILPNSLYLASITQKKKFGCAMGIFLAALYAILFSILQMEQYALLTGTLLVVGMLYIVMYLTKKADIFEEIQK